MKIGLSILAALSLVAFSCGANESITVSTETVKKLIPHYFGGNAHLSTNQQPSYVSGDFNHDGYTDIAILFQPDTNKKPNARIRTSTPWLFPGTEQSNKYYTSLAIINGHDNGFLSSQTKVFGLLDNSGVLETPSFKLILIKSTDNDYKEHQSMLPVKANGDILILPTEAGIDTYIYWNKDKYELHVPEEAP